VPDASFSATEELESVMSVGAVFVELTLMLPDPSEAR
jgi:hypothetical protein